ncbi:MAG: carotenoid oxygenase family protein [Pleurocapsa sp. MO_226.B13]|nr:carotenoid oxygenase family protein [Pleurocapsa sp. MO_226.B13]
MNSRAISRSFDVKDWQKGYQSQPHEYQYRIDQIEGEIPGELQGTLYRNGPGLLDVNGFLLKHPFDGDGMISAISFINGHAYYRNRFVRTEGYLAEQKAGQILYRGFATQKPGGWLANVFDTQPKNVANTNVIHWGDRLLALWEAGQPHSLEPRTLNTIGIENLGGVLEPGQPFSAHPRIIKSQDEKSNILVNFGLKIGFLSSTIIIFELDTNYNLLSKHSHAIPGFAFIHDFAVTPNYLIFFQNPLVYNPLPFAFGLSGANSGIEFCPNLPTRVIIIPRNKKEKMRIIETDPFFTFHHANAWEVENQVYVDSVCYPAFPAIEPNTDFLQIDFDSVPTAELWRFEINLEQGIVKHQVLEHRSCELPMFHPHHIGRPYRYLYLNASHAPKGNGPQQAIIKIDLETGERQLWSAAPRGFVGDLAFVPRPDSLQEDDGWLLTYVYDGAYHRSDLMILDARNLTQGPVARLHLKHHIPHGIHVSWSQDFVNRRSSL